jgi:hypothetical protein
MCAQMPERELPHAWLLSSSVDRLALLLLLSFFFVLVFVFSSSSSSSSSHRLIVYIVWRVNVDQLGLSLSSSARLVFGCEARHHQLLRLVLEAHTLVLLNARVHMPLQCLCRHASTLIGKGV